MYNVQKVCHGDYIIKNSHPDYISYSTIPPMNVKASACGSNSDIISMLGSDCTVIPNECLYERARKEKIL